VKVRTIKYHNNIVKVGDVEYRGVSGEAQFVMGFWQWFYCKVLISFGSKIELISK